MIADKGNVITLHEDEGYRSGLVVAVGPKYLQVIWPDSSGMKIHKVPVRTARYEVIEYPVAKCKRILRRCGKAFGITKSARRALTA